MTSVSDEAQTSSTCGYSSICDSVISEPEIARSLRLNRFRNSSLQVYIGTNFQQGQHLSLYKVKQSNATVNFDPPEIPSERCLRRNLPYPRRVSALVVHYVVESRR